MGWEYWHTEVSAFKSMDASQSPWSTNLMIECNISILKCLTLRGFIFRIGHQVPPIFWMMKKVESCVLYGHLLYGFFWSPKRQKVCQSASHWDIWFETQNGKSCPSLKERLFVGLVIVIVWSVSRFLKLGPWSFFRLQFCIVKLSFWEFLFRNMFKLAGRKSCCLKIIRLSI